MLVDRPAQNLSPRARSRRGSLTVELLLLVPLLLIVLLGTVEFSLWLSAQQKVALASREGARTAARGGSVADVQQAVHLVLGDAVYQQTQVQATLTDGNGNPQPPGGPVAVVVALPVGVLVPDLLAFTGVSFGGKLLVAQTVMLKE
jgi:Flp pilus assembly protein TadG